MRGFITNGPYSDAFTIKEAKGFISQMRVEVTELKQSENSIRSGLNIFKIEQPPSNDIVNMEKVRKSCMYVHVHVHVHVQFSVLTVL